MERAFTDDPAAPGTRVWRVARGGAVLPLVGAVITAGTAVFLAAVSLGIVAAADFGSFATRSAAALPLALTVGLLVALARLMWRDARGRRRGELRLEGDRLVLDLPADRSLIHRPPACRESIPFAHLARVETRLEAYPAQGMANMQRTYRLVRLGAPPVFLFEERAVGTGLEEASLAPVALEIAERTGAPLKDLGLVQGKGGLLAAWFTEPPPWDAAALPPEGANRLWSLVARTGTLAAAGGALVLLVHLLSLAFK
jgi:hypothetical protein